MFPSTTTWSNLVKTKYNLSDHSLWPKFHTKQSKTLTIKSSVNLETDNDKADDLVQCVKNLNISNENEIQEINSNYKTDNRTREQILEDRRTRRRIAKEEKELRDLEEKARKVRAPKSQKIQIIDNKFLEKYLNANTKEKVTSLENETSSLKNTSNKFDRKSIKHKLKHKNKITLSLNDLIVNKNKEKLTKINNQNKGKIFKSTVVIITKHKGKQYELPRKKSLTPLKKNILLIRKLRREIRESTFSQESANKTEIQEESSNSNLKIEKNIQNQITIKHSRKFRSYCNNFITPELCKLVESLLQDIFRFQKRAYDKNQIKGRAKRRYFVGFKEVQKHLDLGQIKLLIIAPDLEPDLPPKEVVDIPGINAAVEKLKNSADKLGVPYLFAILRRRIGYILLKKVPISCVGVSSYEGSDENYTSIIEILKEERDKYENAVLGN